LKLSPGKKTASMFISPIRQRVGHTPQQDPKIAICAQPKLIDHPGLRKARAADLTKYRRSAVRDIATLSTSGVHERTFSRAGALCRTRIKVPLRPSCCKHRKSG